MVTRQESVKLISPQWRARNRIKTMSPRATVIRRPSLAQTEERPRPSSVSPLSPRMRDFTQPWLDLNDKSVLVTGGTGSFGKHFVKTVIENYKPRRLVIYSRDELK